MISIPGYELGDIMLSDREIKERVKELGRRITEDYAGEKLLVIGILKGAFVFMSDLIREIDLDLERSLTSASRADISFWWRISSIRESRSSI